MAPKNALILWIQVLVMLYPSVTGIAAEYHVSKTGNDNNPGTAGMPFLTIQRAANAAHAGDIITVHQGVIQGKCQSGQAMKSGKNVLRMRNQLITSDLLGKALVTSQGYVHPDGTAVIIDSDFFELPRNRKNPTAGPVENLQSETIAISTDRWGVKLR